MDKLTPLRAIRAHCLDCSGDSQKSVRFCPSDGLHSTWCGLWPYRFGKRPETVEDQRIIVPECMPDDLATRETITDADLKPLPGGYKAPERRKLSDEQRREATERLRRGREAKAAAV